MAQERRHAQREEAQRRNDQDPETEPQVPRLTQPTADEEDRDQGDQRDSLTESARTGDSPLRRLRYASLPSSLPMSVTIP